MLAPRLPSSKVMLLGFGSEPVTIAPLSSSMRANPLMPHPPMPIKCTRLPVNRLGLDATAACERGSATLLDSIRSALNGLFTSIGMVQTRQVKSRQGDQQNEEKKISRFSLSPCFLVLLHRPAAIICVITEATAVAASGLPRERAACAI